MSITRKEIFLAKMTGADVSIPAPLTREEFYLAKLCGEDVTVPLPVTMDEIYLYALCGGDVTPPKAVTRLQMFMAKALDMDVPDLVPITREEFYWADYDPSNAELLTVTGVAPIALANAISHAMKSLTQTGKCTQASTPTPSAPVDIMCNNGALRMADDELPSGYKRITGIKFDGDFWYNTGEALTGADDVTMTLANTSSTGQNVFGSYNGTASGTKNFSLFIYGGGSSTNSYFRYGEQLLRPKFGSNERTITFGKSGTDGFATDVTATSETFTTPANAYIGMLPNSTSPAFTGSIIGNILVGNRLKYIPCERQSDGAVGYYELNSGGFLAPVGTGTPTKGNYDTSHFTVLSVVGTPEVLTIGADGAETQTVTNIPMLLSVGDYKDEGEIISGIKTSKVGVKVLNGTENWQDHGTYSNIKMLYVAGSRSGGAQAITSTHYVGTSESNASMPVDSIKLSRPNASDENGTVYIKTDSLTLADFKTFLAAQYAAGTPVIVIYPLATETTESVTAQPLSTVEGTNTVSVTAEVSDIPLEAQYYGIAG